MPSREYRNDSEVIRHWRPSGRHPRARRLRPCGGRIPAMSQDWPASSRVSQTNPGPGILRVDLSVTSFIALSTHCADQFIGSFRPRPAGCQRFRLRAKLGKRRALCDYPNGAARNWLAETVQPQGPRLKGKNAPAVWNGDTMKLTSLRPQLGHAFFSRFICTRSPRPRVSTGPTRYWRASNWICSSPVGN